MNPLYQMMNQNNPLAMLDQIKKNPYEFLTSKGVNIPQGMNNPNQIIQHHMNTGQISQAQYNKAANMARMLKR